MAKQTNNQPKTEDTAPETSNAPESPQVEVPETGVQVQEGGATVNREYAGNHADAMEPYGDALANSQLVAVHSPTAGADVVTAPTGAQLPARTHGIDPEGPVAEAEVPDVPAMATVYAPNENYTGHSAGVQFVNGVGQTDKPHLLEWFRDHGYKVEG